VRTVQRAITQAKSEGLIGVARAKKTDVPPGWKEPVPCGWSHRWVVGWGRAGKAVHDAICAAKAKWIVKHAASSVPPKLAAPERAPVYVPGRGVRTPYQRRDWTAAELDAELARLALLEKPPD
jgi:hypothetical protein